MIHWEKGFISQETGVRGIWSAAVLMVSKFESYVQ
jgi:hypothetical protein